MVESIFFKAFLNTKKEKKLHYPAYSESLDTYFKKLFSDWHDNLKKRKMHFKALFAVC